MRGKKGVSPLVATALLILFSVLLGAAVMSWGQEYVEKHALFVQTRTLARSGCDAASFDIIMLSGIKQLCVRNNMIEVIVENGPDTELYDLHARVIGTKDVSVAESVLPRPLPKAYAMKVAFGMSPVGIVQQIKFVPKIKVNNNVIYCSNHAQIFENIRSCT